MNLIYKDRSVKETITLAEDYFEKLNITLIKYWKNDVKGLFSVLIKIKDTQFSVNGKGCSEDFALASGYGELIERLQNEAFFYINTRMYKYLNYKKESLNNLKNGIYDWCNLVGLKNKKSIQCLIDYSDLENEREYFEFYCYEDNSKIVLPLKLLGYVYGTNGMAAGNSKNEAFVQALSEILERYIVKELLTKNIVPPEIPNEILENYPYILDCKKNIESRGNLKIKIIDLSLGLDIPGVGIILTSLETKSYFVKIAVHPHFKIALERCFTELMQGKNVHDYNNMVSIFLDKSIYEDNIMQIFINGEGYYNDNLFSTQKSYQLKKWKEFDSQKSMADYLIELFSKLNCKIYIKEVNESAFYSLHVIAPGISEILELDNFNKIERQINFEEVCNIMNSDDWNKSRDKQLIVYKYLSTYKFSEKTTMGIFYAGHTYNKKAPYYRVPLLLFQAMLCKQLGYNQESSELLLDFCKIYDVPLPIKDYYLCFAFVILKGITDLEYLKNWFDEKTILRVLEDEKKNVFYNINMIYCNHNCNLCSNCDKCYYPRQRNLYERYNSVL